MTHRSLFAGFLVALLLPVAAHAASKSLYQRIVEQVEREQAEGTADDDVATFIRLLLDDEWDDLTDDDVKNVLKGDGVNVCGNKPNTSDLRNQEACARMISSAQRIAADQQKIRLLGRNLESIATSFELPLSDLPDRALRLSADLQGILSIWSAGTGSIKNNKSAPVIRTVTIPDDDDAPVNQEDVEDILKDLARELNDLSAEERIAAVWRYREGVRLVRDYRVTRFPAPFVGSGSEVGTERQYLFKRWDDNDDCDDTENFCIEKFLLDLRDLVMGLPVEPPLTSSETAYVLFPASMLESTMPDNVIVWVRLDGDTINNQPFGDVGLQWSIPLEPVMPSLFYIDEDDEQQPILGGTYPPEPAVRNSERVVIRDIDGDMLCTTPIALRGYMCRSFEEASANARCPVRPDPTNDIQLVACTKTIDGYEDTWCCDPGSNQCSAVKTASECTQRGGKASATAAGCAVNGCAVPPTTPVFCCLPEQNKRCVQMVNASSCTQQGGKTSTDANGCITNGCKAPEPETMRYTAASSDVCREISWKLSKPFDPNTQCRLQLRCADTCPIPGVIASASLKDGAGVIDLCIENNNQGVTSSYVLYHELVHAYQFCAMPPGLTNLYNQIPYEEAGELCCRIEGEAYRANCAMMERDGVFDGASFGGIPINDETCAEIATDRGCKGMTSNGKNLPGCFLSRDYPPGFFEAYFQTLSKNPKNLPAKCPEVLDVEKMDPRVRELAELIQSRYDVCTPGNITDYKNRIGNNLCFIGQCVEQSAELHRLTGTRATGTTQDAMAPWQEPMTGTPLGNILTNPPLATYSFPPYRPQLLVRTLDHALCQSVGLPALTPTILCVVEANRQLGQTRASGVEMAMSLLGQTLEQQKNVRDLTELSRGLGIRTGTELYANYLRESNRSFADIIRMADTLLNDLKSVSLPTEMCPISPGLPSRLSSSPAS